MSYRLEVWRPALREVRGLPRYVRAQARQLIRALGTQPRPGRAKELRGKPDIYRIWLADCWRIAYEVDDDSRRVLVLRVRRKGAMDDDSLSSEIHQVVAVYGSDERTPRGALAPEASDWPAQGEWSYDDYRRLPDDGWRYEIIRGVLHVSPAPSFRHQIIVSNLLFLFRLFLREHPVARVVPAPIDVLLPAVASPVQPDLVLITSEQLGVIREGRIESAPDLVVEVLSPSNWLTDRREKYEAYAVAGVREYWVVDPEGSSVEVFVLRQRSYDLAGKFELGDRVRSQVLRGFEPRVDEIFGD